MYLLNIGRAVSSNQFEGGGKKRKKVATFVQDLLTQCELHPSQNKELTAGWRCTDINSEKTWCGMNHRIPKAFRHQVMHLKLWGGKKIGFASSLGFVACKSWGCWAWCLCLKGDAAVLPSSPAQGHNAPVAGTTSKLSTDSASTCPRARQSHSTWFSSTELRGSSAVSSQGTGPILNSM